MVPYSENECADYMKALKGKLGGLLQFWHTSYNVLEHVEYITGGPSDGGRQKFCVQGIIKALKPGKTYEHNQTENQTHLSQENHRNLPARRIY